MIESSILFAAFEIYGPNNIALPIETVAKKQEQYS